MLTAEFTYIDGSGVSLSSQRVTFFRGSTEVRVVLSATVTATSGTLTAEASDEIDAVVESAMLAVEIVPRAFSLVFEPDTVQPAVGSPSLTRLSLVGIDTGLGIPGLGDTEELPISLERLQGVTFDAPDPLVFSSRTSSIELTVTASVNSAGGVVIARVEEDVSNATIGEGRLDVDVVSDVRSFAVTIDGRSVSVLGVSVSPSATLSTHTQTLTVSLNEEVPLAVDEVVVVNLSLSVLLGSDTTSFAIEPSVLEFRDMERSTTVDLLIGRKGVMSGRDQGGCGNRRGRPLECQVQYGEQVPFDPGGEEPAPGV